MEGVTASLFKGLLSRFADEQNTKLLKVLPLYQFRSDREIEVEGRTSGHSLLLGRNPQDSGISRQTYDMLFKGYLKTLKT